MIELRPLSTADVEAHNAGEDEETVRWLSEKPSTTESTRSHFDMLASNSVAGQGKRGFGVWLDGTLAGYIDFDPDADDRLAEGDVTIAYSVHPWARRRGVASGAVRLLCEHLAAEGLGRRAIIHVASGNAASAGVAVRSGFVVVQGSDGEDLPADVVVYARDL